MIEVRNEGLQWAAYRVDGDGFSDFPIYANPDKQSVIDEAKRRCDPGESVEVRELGDVDSDFQFGGGL